MAGPDATADERIWRELAEKAVGASLDLLQSRTHEGLRIAPLYSRAAAPEAQPWRQERAWTVAQRVDHPATEDANALALKDLEGGADALVLVDRASPYARGFGSDLAGGDLDRLLEGVDLDLIKLRLDAGGATLQVLGALADLIVARRLTSAALDVDVAFDPIGWSARLDRPISTDAQPLAALRARAGLSGTAFLADGRPWHEAGAGEAEELAIVLSTALAYLRAQDAAGVPLADAQEAIALLLSADADIFMGIAKVRAMRRLWSRVGEACGLSPNKVRLHVETSWRMMSRRDPWINVMRATAAAFAAGLGGADVIAVLPFTLPLGLPDEPARRLGRNIQRILLDEAHLEKVEDPSAGSGAFEHLTQALCERAWMLFQEIERAGGMDRPAALGLARDRVAATAAARAHVLGDAGRFGEPEATSSCAILEMAPYPPLPRGGEALPILRDDQSPDDRPQLT